MPLDLNRIFSNRSSESVTFSSASLFINNFSQLLGANCRRLTAQIDLWICQEAIRLNFIYLATTTMGI